MDSIERRAYDLFEATFRAKARRNYKIQIEVYGKVNYLNL
jgi:hypothetical protein